MRDILRVLNDTITARGSIVLSEDGLLIASEVRDGVDVDRLSALGAAIVNEIGASLRQAGLRAFSQVEVAAEQGKVILVKAGPAYLLVLLGARIEVGPGSLEILSAASRVEREAELAA